MKEKLKAFFKCENLKVLFRNESLKRFFKKVFSKKVITAAIVIAVLLGALRIGFSLMFEVEGTVLKLDGNNIEVANFLYTKTVNTGTIPVDSNKIQVGEKVKILKNLHGDVISIQGSHRKYDGYERGNREKYSHGGPNQKEFKGRE